MKSFPVWPTSITLFFILFATVFIGFAIWAATHSPVQLVEEDYYAKELLYQEEIDRVARAGAQPPQVTLEPSTSQLHIQMPASTGEQAPEGSVRFYRPSNKAWDFERPLSVDPSGVQEIDLRDLERGLWRVSLRWTDAGEAFEWRQDMVLE